MSNSNPVLVSFPISETEKFLPHAQKVLDEVRKRSEGKSVFATTSYKDGKMVVEITVTERGRGR